MKEVAAGQPVCAGRSPNPASRKPPPQFGARSGTPSSSRRLRISASYATHDLPTASLESPCAPAAQVHASDRAALGSRRLPREIGARSGEPSSPRHLLQSPGTRFRGDLGRMCGARPFLDIRPNAREVCPANGIPNGIRLMNGRPFGITQSITRPPNGVAIRS